VVGPFGRSGASRRTVRVLHVHALTYLHVNLATAPWLEDSATPAVTGGPAVHSLADVDHVSSQPLAKIIAEFLSEPDDPAAPFQSGI
jgi:hypothetical protein